MKKIRNMILNFIRYIILGPSYFKHRLLIKKSKKWSALEIERFQKKKIKNKRKTILTKQEIRDNIDKYTNSCFVMPLKKVRTGGTSGKPLIFYQDYFFTRQKERAYLHDIWSKVGYKPFDYRIIVRGNIPNNGKRYDWLENSLIISQDYFVEENKSELISIFTKKDFFLHVYPSTLFFLIDYWGEDTFKTFPIKGVLAGSESFPHSQMLWFEKKFPFKISHWYGHSEYAILARFCMKCGEFHFYPTYGKVELLKDENNLKIIATSFNKCGTQFHNYFTEDFAESSESKCDEDSFFKVKRIIGRKQEYVYDKNNNKKAFGPYLFGIHSHFWDNIKSIQFIQNQKGKLLIYYIPKENFNLFEFKSILQRRFKEYDLEFFMTSSIPKTSTGKHKYFIQNID